MDDSEVGKLQIHSVEEADARSAICVVRCVGGVVRPGQRFGEDPSTSLTGEAPGQLVEVDWIERYQRRVEFVDPPNSAKVRLCGNAVSLLEKGMTIVSQEK
ncbi:hypothetical protein ABZ858_32020 [Streptomyces sp. NPDC047017]|uniref:hypothetical protein n=1 Tax=Streptomyces sp. NPDC047017 TaxID=3155024 RepID=UPI0033E7FED4